ncbi:ABC transporter ATP-binding protein [Clostridium manihotivorum]|uniref:ABC transporter domain-containing protein n=1 Tax=Clostridium manihotivorum TaxID=2320868 RepID=A0A3R5V9B7_9CLOT|nr:ATP-binding cassette domain-containing protein [Clostridium manihotivorum]QAA33118.1 hypothetical protein C1I91_16555 [Clostridium manihotivorum]
MEFVVFRVNNKFAKEIRKAEYASEEIVKSKTKMKMIHEAFFAIFAAFVIIIKIILIYISWKEDKMSAGALIALLTLIDKAYSPIAIFNVLFVQYKLDKTSFQRLINILNMPDEINLNSGKVLMSTEGNIYFDNVGFSYNNKNIFKKLELRIESGSAIALVGESGAGKSTIVKLLLGLVKPKEGKIFIDSYDLSELRLWKYYDFISYTSQESPIFSGTLRENIIFDKEASDSEIIKAMYQVGLEDFYKSLPMGLDTEVGERGIMLSGGERQRVALARIYFSEAKIVILDEATSALDNITEQLVMRRLKEFLKNKTIITIAHRLNSIKDYDVIYAFKAGEIDGLGSFDQLISESQYFKKLWNNENHKNYYI